MLPPHPTCTNHSSDHCRTSAQGLNHSQILRGDSEGDSHHAECMCRSPSQCQVGARGLSMPGQTCNAAQACVNFVSSRGRSSWPSMVSILHAASRDYHVAHYLWQIRALPRCDLPVHEYLYQLSDKVDFFSSPELWREDLCVPRDIKMLSSSKMTRQTLASPTPVCYLPLHTTCAA